jgi:uncharacterized protein YoaH (UPF0181 family)
MAVARKKTALYLDERLMESAKLIAAASGKHAYEVIEEALRAYVVARREEAGRRMHELLKEVAERQEREGVPRLSDGEAMALAAEELRMVRAERTRHEQPIERRSPPAERPNWGPFRRRDPTGEVEGL